MQSDYCLGQLVRLRVQPSRIGSISGIRSDTGGRCRIQVFHGKSDVREYYPEQIEHVPDNPPSLSGAREFHARLTAARLLHPLTDHLYALHSARIRFIPFQFKPLLRVLRSDRPRLLVADEVGVGKTIEAGLILKELKARQSLENVLIVCPRALVGKWLAEMRRFDEDFTALDGDALRYCLRETHRDGVWPSKYSRAIVHLEVLRQEEHILGSSAGRNEKPGFLTLDPPPRFSLTIVDEAHHLRNPSTLSHQVGRLICDLSEAVVFLSATPVQLGSANLFSLLNLIRPDTFPSEHVFREMAAPNRHLHEASRHLRSVDPQWKSATAKSLRAASATVWGAQTLPDDPRFAACLRLVDTDETPAATTRIAALRDLEELQTFSHVMNRTRRRDIGRFTTREPHTVATPFTEKQAEFYGELRMFRISLLSLEYEPIVVRLLVDTLERQVASCLPALVPVLDRFLSTGRLSTAALGDGADEDEEAELPPALLGQAQRLRRLAASLPDADPKADSLLGIVHETMAADGPRKVLIFSFFLHTLGYLQKKLEVERLRVGTITGKIPEEERELVRERFRKPTTDPDAIDVLLSSEVGCEGLDYEFCDRLVNYDIPWNPMRIEQRIGRIDRYGQQAKKVLIFNFITPGTVEERIFFRCFERIGVFRDTVGDCEEVLGEMSLPARLADIARDPSLSPEQADEQARQIADNAVRLTEERRRLEEQSGGLLGLDDAFAGEPDELEREGRWVSPKDLAAMIGFYVSRDSFGGRFEVDATDASFHRLRLSKDARATFSSRCRQARETGRSAVEFQRWLDGGEPQWRCTLDQTTACERREMPFVTPLHPLTRIAARDLAGTGEIFCAALKVRTADFPAGVYSFACDLWETIGLRPFARLVVLACDTKTLSAAPAIAGGLLNLLGVAEDAEATLAAEVISASSAALDLETDALHAMELADLRIRNEELASRQRASLEAWNRARLKHLDEEICVATDARIRRMKTAERARVEIETERQFAELKRRSSADLIRQRIATGTIEIVAP